MTVKNLILGLLLVLPVLSYAQQDTIPKDTAMAKRWLNEAKDLLGKGKNDEAERKLSIAAKIFEKTLGKENINYADVMHALGSIWCERGNFDQGILFTQSALSIRLKVLGSEHSDVASSYHNIGLSFYFKGEYGKAIEYLEKGLEISLKTLNKDHFEIATFYSHLGSAYGSQVQYVKAIEYYEKALEIWLRTLTIEHPNIVTLYNNIGIALSSQGEYGRALAYFKKALEIRLKNLGPDHPEVAATYNSLGVSYNSQGKPDTGMIYNKKALKIRLNAFGPEHPDVALSYNNIGISHQSEGQYDKAIWYYEKALEIWLKTLGFQHPYVTETYNNLGISYYSLGEYDKAIEYHEKALGINLEILGEEHPETVRLFNNLALSYNAKKQYSKAIEFYEKTLRILLKTLGAEHPDVAKVYNNIAGYYGFQGEFAKAIEYYEKVLGIFLKTLKPDNPYVAQTYNNLGNVYKLQSKYGMAISNYLNALKSLHYQTNTFEKVNSVEELLKSLLQLSETYEQQNTPQDPKTLQHSLKYAQEALSAVDYLVNFYTTESTKTYWQSTHNPIYEQAIDISLLAAAVNHNDSLRRQTFTYAEKSKATQLQAQLKNANALAFSGIPDSLTQKEYQLRIDLTWRGKQRQGLLDQGKTETDSTVLRLSSILFDLRQQYDTLKTRFEKNYPEYYRLKYDLRTVPLDYVQDTLLQPGQTLLEYFVGDSSIYLFLVQPKNYEVIEIKKDTAFNQWVEDFTRNGIYGYYGKKGVSKGKSINNFGKAAYQLYETLIAPIKAKLPEKGKLIIIPDGILGYVPFEALLTEKPPRPDAIQEYKYLIQKHQISYCYSATLLKEMQNKRHRQEPTQTLLAMAPFFLGNADTLLSQVDSTEFMAGITLRDTLTALPNSGEEVARIQKILKGQAFYGKAATLVQFQKLADQASILHLSTHAEADNRLGDYAYLAFSMPNANGTFDKLYVHDLYNLSLNADLVVLSACETGIGKLQRGEGIVSLARAFAYAGAKSIVTTLWKVSDEHSKNLMTSFYKYLRQGKEKDEALHLAKLEFLQKNEKKTELLHPFFWASFIGIGDMRGLENIK